MKQQILIAKEKHGTRYFDASTPELLAAAAFKLLSERFENDYYIPWEEEPDATSILSESQISELPNERLRNAESQRRNAYLWQLANWKKESANFEKIKKTIETKNQSAAWYILQSFSGGEYESVELEELESAD